MPRRFSSEIGVVFRRRLAACLRRSVAVLSPAEWRVDTTGTGLFLLEQNSDGKWWLKGLFFSLADAFDAAEELHGPVSGLAARWAELAGRYESRSEQCLMDVDSPWAGCVYRNAVASNPFQLDLGHEPVTAAPLSPNEVARFVAARFAASGRPRDTMQPEAIVDLIGRSGSSLHEISALAGAAVFLADLEGAPHVGCRHVQTALSIRDENGIAVAAAQPRPERTRVREARMSNARLAVALAALLIVLTSSLAAKWLAVEPAPAGLTELPAGPSMQVATTTLPQPATLPAPVQPSSPAPAPALAKSLPAPTVLANAAGQPSLADRPLVTAASVPPPLMSSRIDAVRQEEPSDSLGFFEGPVDNQTMNRSGRLALAITKDPVSGTIRATFHAGEGLLGTGELSGNITPDGRISASGVLMMGRNPFLCDLVGQLSGSQLVGSAQFVRPWGGRIAHSVFRLARS